ncbi:hypothetical protein MMC30_006510 [Trapelia coarctata]|nr:hypothetical protein [Trapelia coarctata]
MSAAIHHLVSRGVEIAKNRDFHQHTFEFKLPTWGLVMLLSTTVLFFLFAGAIRYTYGEVVATLAMVETPNTTTIIETSPEEQFKDDPDAPLPSEKEGLLLVKQEVLVIKTKPITAKLCSTIKHLRSRAGFFSRFRGLHVLALYGLTFHLLRSLFLRLVPGSLLTRSIATIVTSTLLCRFNATWTHIVISNPSEKRFYRRVPPRTAFRQLAGPTLWAALAEQLAVVAPLLMAHAYGLEQYAHDPSKFGNVSPRVRGSVLIQATLVMLVGFFNVIFIIIPTHAALKRVQASILPEEDEGIVPFDRTFGGKVLVANMGGIGRMSIREAWKSFDKEAMFRLYKVYAKVALMQGALFMVYMAVMVGEMKLILGDQLDKMIMAARGN